MISRCTAVEYAFAPTTDTSLFLLKSRISASRRRRFSARRYTADLRITLLYASETASAYPLDTPMNKFCWSDPYERQSAHACDLALHTTGQHNRLNPYIRCR